MSSNLAMVAGAIYTVLILVSNVWRAWQVRLVVTALVFDVIAIAGYAIAAEWAFVGIWFVVGLFAVYLLTQAQRLAALRREERDAEAEYQAALSRLRARL